MQKDKEAQKMLLKKCLLSGFIIGLFLCIVGCVRVQNGSFVIPYGEILSHLSAPDYIARLDVPGTAIITSYDPTGGNDDFNHPLRVTPEGWAVLADLKGPGYVSRFWFTGSDNKHRIRFFFDNERNPRIDMTIQEFCGGVFPFRPPLAVYENYCWYNYVPIPYAKRLVIMTQKGGTQPDGGPKLFHQINYTSLPQTSRVSSFNLKLSPEDGKALGDVVERLKNISQFKCTDGELFTKNINIAAGGKQSVILPDGPIMIRELVVRPVLDNLSSPLQRKAFLRDVILKIYWDGQAEASVAVPFGSFFGSVWQKTTFDNMFFGMTNDYFFCRFPMPYRAKAVVEFENQMTNAVGFNITVKGEEGEKLPASPVQYGFFHAAWNRTTERDIGKPHCVLNVNGQGRYAGCILSALSLDKNFWLLEGDEIMTRDGESQLASAEPLAKPGPFWRGTGLEDYFNGGWYYQNVLCRPLHGLLFKSFFRTVQYRVHLPDPVIFKNKFNMIFERGPDNNSRGWMESVAFYYLDQPRAAGSELLTPNERKPPVDEPQIAGFMLDFFNYERFGDYRGEIESMEAFLEQYSDSPFSDVLKLRTAACIERIAGMAQSRPIYEKIAAESKDAAAIEQAKMLLWFHERNGNAILGLYANTPARCFLDGQLITETSHPAKLTTAALELKPGRHVLAIQCRYHPYPAWIQACLRTHSGAVITGPSWKHCVDPSGNWPALDYNDSSWQIAGGTGSKGPPEEPFIWIEPNAFVDMQSLAVAIFCSIPWPDKTKPLVFRHVFEIQKQ